MTEVDIDVNDEPNDHNIIVIFDRYFPVSTKSYERERRAIGQSYPFHKLTPQTILPPRDAVLKNTENKKELISQLCLIDSEYVTMIGDECPFGHE